MPRQFVYAPGLPGYGTRGVDGSAGLTGIATYFSAYDGNSDSVTIKSKIIANKELFSNDELIPGYPTRTYQSGDIFIDRNARIFQIDFNEGNLYKDTGIFLNISGFFSSGPIQSSSPEFERYSNSYETQKYLIDIVYSDTVGDYTTYPTSIYDNATLYYAQVKYVDQLLGPNFTNVYPFQVWTIGDSIDDNAIALVREKDTNLWRFGNYDDGSVRDVSMYLDFKDLYFTGKGIFEDEALLKDNLYFSGDKNHDIQIKNPTSSRTLYIKGSEPPIGQTSGGIIEIGGGDASTSSTENGGSGGNIVFRGEDGGDYTGIGVDYNGGTGSNILFYTGDGGDSTEGLGGRGGNLSIYMGDGGKSVNDAGNGGDGGLFALYGGNGGDSEGGSNQNAGDGTRFFISLGDGGQVLSGTGTGGKGGDFYLAAGNSGDSFVNIGPGDAKGIQGAGFSLISGNGGGISNIGAGNEIGGDGGDVSIYGGNANGSSSYFEGGRGGNIYLEGGQGGIGAINNGAGGIVFINGGKTAVGSGQGEVFIQNNYGGKTSFSGNVDVSGNLTIKNTYELKLPDGTATDPALNFDSDGNTGIYRYGTDQIGFSLNGSPRWRMSDSGGLSNLFSNAPIYIQPDSNSGVSGDDITIIAGDSNSANAGDLFLKGGDVDSGTGAGGSVTIQGGNGTTTGDVYITTTAGSIVNGKIQIQSNTGIGGGLYFRGLPTTGSMTYHLAQNSTTGECHLSSTTPSDIRVKDLKESLSGKDILNSLKNINGWKWSFNDYSEKIYDLIDKEKIHYGLIAQEVQAYFPEVISKYEGNNKDEILIIDYEMLVPVLVEAVKEQQNRIEDLKNIIDKQQEQINKLLELSNLK